MILPEPLGSEVDRLSGEDRFIDAVRLVRRRTAPNLLPATLAVRPAAPLTSTSQD